MKSILIWWIALQVQIYCTEVQDVSFSEPQNKISRQEMNTCFPTVTGRKAFYGSILLYYTSLYMAHIYCNTWLKSFDWYNNASVFCGLLDKSVCWCWSTPGRVGGWCGCRGETERERAQEWGRWTSSEDSSEDTAVWRRILCTDNQTR